MCKENGEDSKDTAHGVVNLLYVLAGTQKMHCGTDWHWLINRQHYRNNTTIIINETEVKPRDFGKSCLVIMILSEHNGQCSEAISNLW